MQSLHEFTGKWITNGMFSDMVPVNVFQRAPESAKTGAVSGIRAQHVLFRARFTVRRRKDVRLFLSADDYYKLYVNGSYVAQGPAASYPNAYYYNEIDLTPYVREGENVIAVHTYYQGLINRVWVSGDNRHGLIYDVCEEGTLIACSDEHVKVKVHSGYRVNEVIGYDTQFTEVYDAGAEEVGFFREDFDDGSFENARLRLHVDYRLVAQPTRLLEISMRQPAKTERTERGVLVDFGQEIVGYPVIRARGKRGETLLVRCGEELNDDGSVRYRMRCNCTYEDKLILSGETDTSDFFDYKAFRYLEAICPPDAEIQEIYALVRHYPYRAVSKCKYADKTLQSIFRLCENTVHYGVQEGYLDCPTREKGQYFGDACYTALAHYFLTDDPAMMKKLIAEAFSSEFIDGGLTAGGPSAFLQEIAEFPLMVICLLYACYLLTQDKAFAQEYYPAAERVLNCYLTRYGFPLTNVDKWCVVDWPESARDGYDCNLPQKETVRETHNVICAYFLLAAKALNALGRALGKKEDGRIPAWERAYKAAFYRPERKLFCDREGSEHSALASNLMGALAVETEPAFLENLTKMVEKKRLSCSNLFMTPLMFYWLKKQKKESLLLSLIQDKSGWVNMLKEGATTTFEAFSKENKWNASLCHTMFAFPVIFLSDNARAEERLFGKN